MLFFNLKWKKTVYKAILINNKNKLIDTYVGIEGYTTICSYNKYFSNILIILVKLYPFNNLAFWTMQCLISINSSWNIASFLVLNV